MQTKPSSKKLLIAGYPNVGKTSIHVIIFGTHPTKKASEAQVTIGTASTQNRFMNDLETSTWDTQSGKTEWCNVQDDFLKGVEVLVYVFNIEDDKGGEDIKNFKRCVEKVRSINKNPKVFVLVHKMDKISIKEKEKTFNEKRQKIMEASESISVNLNGIYATSIWDDTLYRSWSEIARTLMPDLEMYTKTLQKLASACDCDEAVLFDKKTFLIIDHYEKELSQEIEKYERVSTIMKQFKLNCKPGTDISSLQVRNSKFVAIIKEFTENTYIMVISFNSRIELTAIDLTLAGARKYFEKKTEQVLVV